MIREMTPAPTFILAALALAVGAAEAQQAAEGTFAAGQPLGITNPEGDYTAASENVSAYGGLVNAESCSFDETRDLIVAPSRGANQDEVQNDGFVALLNHDGSIHTPKWIGATRDGLILNHPFGSDIADGMLYLADRNGGTTPDDPAISVVRMFDMETGAPAGEIVTEGSNGLNDIEVADDGTIYGSQTGAMDDPTTWRLYKITPDGTATVLVEGDPLARPNGVAIDGDGNIVVVTIGDDAVLTFSPAGELLKTEQSAQPGNDGLVIMPDGTKYVSSVRYGGITRIPPEGESELIATGIPSAASMCYDSGQNQLVVPMNAFNGFSFVNLD